MFLAVLGNIGRFLSRNPITIFIVLIVLMGIVLVQTLQSNQKLKKEKELLTQALKNEEQRSVNNLKALNDTIKYLREDSIYTKRILAVKQNEVKSLDAELQRAYNNVRKVSGTGKVKEVPKFIYVTDINSNVSTSDVDTKVERMGDTLSIGVNSENQLFRVKTQTWFSLIPDSTKQKLVLKFVDKYGLGKPSLLDFTLKFKLQIVQTELTDGSKRVYIKPVDLEGNAIDPALLGITNVKGVDFIDIPSAPPPLPTTAKKQKIVIGLGPQAGVTYMSGTFKPYVGIGVSVGINLLR